MKDSSHITTTITRNHIATAIAIIFHIVGFVGIVFFDRDQFIRLTPINLILMFLLLLYTQKRLNGWFLLFALLCFSIGIAVEIIGTGTGWLFGNYSYGKVLGPSFKNVPWIIGINWFIIIYCAGITIYTVLNGILEKMAGEAIAPKTTLKALSIIVDGATLATLFDLLLEPVAIKLGYWQWDGGNIPFYNYICWFIIGALLLTVFHYAKFYKKNKFAVNLLLIQAMFFLLLRTFI